MPASSGVLSNVYADATRGKVRGGLNGSWNSNYIGTKDSGQGPHCFIVEGDPGFVIKPHFHGVNQFQVCAGGSGMLGKSPLTPGVLHYADAYTPYGPLVASDRGLTFFTLRQMAQTGTHYVPGAKKEEKKAPTGRNLVTRAEPERRGTSGVRHLIDQADGVHVIELAGAAHEMLPDPDGLVKHGSAYVVVFAGSITVEGRDYPERSVLFVPEGERVPALACGPDGALAAFMSFAAGGGAALP